MRVSLDTKRIYYINVTVMLCDTLSRITWFAFVLSVQKHSNNYIVLPKAIIFRIDLYTRSIIENILYCHYYFCVCIPFPSKYKFRINGVLVLCVKRREYSIQIVGNIWLVYR